MRKYLYVLLCASFVLMQASCGSSSDNPDEEYPVEEEESIVGNIMLAHRVNEMNSDCPMDLGFFGELTSVFFDSNKAVVMRVNVSEDAELDFDAMRKNMEQFKNGFIASFAGSKDSKILMQEIANADARFTLRFVKNDATDSVDFNFSNEEVKDALKNNDKPLTAREKIENMANNSNVQCPQQVDEATVMTRVCVEGNYMTYYYSVDEKQLDMDVMTRNKAEMKSNVKEFLMSDDPMLEMVRKTCREANIGIRYIYIGSKSKKELKITIEYSEM